MPEFKMPSLGADMEAGTLVAWQKRPGDAVRRGDVVAEVETDKGIIEIEAFENGTLETIVVPEGERVPVGTVLAVIRTEGEEAASIVHAAPVPTAPVATPSPAPVQPAAKPAAPLRRPASPAARRLAQRLSVDLELVEGSGPGGVITREDVERAASAKTAAPRPQTVSSAPVTPAPTAAPAHPTVRPTGDADRQARMRQTIAAAMSRSKREIPHYYLSHTIDLQPVIDWLATENERRPVTDRLLYGVLLLKAVAIALGEVPELNAIWEGDRAVLKPDRHLGVAIALRQGGLIAPALRHVDQKSLDQLMVEFCDLVNRARTGGLRSSELTDPTITVTSLGERGVEMVFGVIYPPQTTIVGFGKPVERPWSIEKNVTSRQVITATLSADHRVSDGHRGGLFLAAVERLLQEPQTL